MADSQATTQLLCQQCAAALVVEAGARYATCEFCGTVNFLDKSQAVLHYAVRPTIDDAQAAAALRRWMAGNQTVKGLDTHARIESQQFQYFPMWLAITTENGREEVHLKPAAALSIVELGNLRVPASDLMPYDDAMDSAAIRASVPVTAVRAWLAENEGLAAGAIGEISLVHVPIYQFKYRYKDGSYTALVDAATGQVFAAIFPEKFELPYVSIGGFGCLAYFLAALIPIITYTVVGNAAGLGIGTLIYIAVAVALAIPIFIAAASVSRKY
ncbi:MAG: PepSY domain-containing protein [Candidatus Promineofilum sp.]|nr:PepSY domain-containing protein [Promineifilum sp.]